MVTEEQDFLFKAYANESIEINLYLSELIESNKQTNRVNHILRALSSISGELYSTISPIIESDYQNKTDKDVFLLIEGFHSCFEYFNEFLFKYLSDINDCKGEMLKSKMKCLNYIYDYKFNILLLQRDFTYSKLKLIIEKEIEENAK